MGLLGKILDREGIYFHHGDLESFNLKGHDAYALRRDKEYFILVAEQVKGWELKFVVAHELGHILFGHLHEDNKMSYAEKEAEADTFASVITALMLFEEFNKPDEIDKEGDSFVAKK